MDGTKCARCGVSMDASEGIWSGDGRVCAGCEQLVMDEDELSELKKRLIGGAWTAFLVGGASVVCNMCFVTSIAAWVFGLGVLGTVMNSPRAREALGKSQATVVVLAILGLLLASAVPLMALGVVLLDALQH